MKKSFLSAVSTSFVYPVTMNVSNVHYWL